ncbi:MAG TPA: hypothetical protein VFO66_05060 [Gemmatimonadaceae bacterium]|nr:hypothetical protein [Gemmatimonadaceae bacterium]
MFVELIDHLRCPEPHADSWLVMHAEETRDRHIIRGRLACPVCGRRFVVEAGAVDFSAKSSDGARERLAAPAVAPDDEWPLRLAAFLALGEGGGAVGLYGSWSRYAEALGDVAEGVEPLAIDPPFATHPRLSAIVPPSRAAIPLATASLRAVAIDALVGDDAGAQLTEAVRVVRPGGRMLAPASLPVPHGIREIARDAAWWVGEREAAPAGIISIASRRR